MPERRVYQVGKKGLISNQLLAFILWSFAHLRAPESGGLL